MSDARELQINASWNDNAAAWSGAVRGGQMQNRVRVTNAAILSAVTRLGPSRGLDIGCGEGWLCRELSQRGIEMAGFDGTPELVELARSAGGGNYQLLTYDQFVADPGAAGGGYDVAICNYSLLGEAIGPVLRAAAATLRPGGSIVVQTVHPVPDMEGRYEDGWRMETFETLGEGFRTPMPWYFRTFGTWLNQLTDAGFRLEHCEEPVHPDTGSPISLLLTGRKLER